MGVEKKNVSKRALLVTSFCLLVCLQPGTLQELGPGANCDGERRNLCGPGTVCQQLSANLEHTCYNKVGRNCTIRGQGYAQCERNTYCDRKKTQICAYPLNRDCSKRRYMCFPGLSCDANSVCRTRVNGPCNSPERHLCGVGAICVDRKCTCIEGRFERKGKTCVPVAGAVGGPCKTEGEKCFDDHSKCRKKTGLCECKQGFVPSTRDFTCKLDVGETCDKNKPDECRLDAQCDTDNKCRLIAGMSCAGDRAQWCQLGDVCREGLCRRKIGDSCRIIHTTLVCEPPTSCQYTNLCQLKMNESCAGIPDACDHYNLCDKQTLQCKKIIGETCLYDGYCVSGAVCINYRCRCHPDGSGIWNSTTQSCGLPDGKAGGRRRTGKGEKPCEDPYAKPNADGVCECKRGYGPHPNYLHCVMNGKKCSVSGTGKINTYFNKNIDVRLPCSFKLAKIKCGRAKVKVYVDNTYEPKIHNNLISAVSAIITDKNDDDTRTSTTYRITLAKITEHLNQSANTADSAWTTVPMDAENDDKDEHVLLSTDLPSGTSTLERKLLKITYSPPVVKNSSTGQYTVQDWGQVLVECGHSSFQSLQQFPYSLCGLPEDTDGKKLSQYQRKAEKELKSDLPDTFGYVSRDAFSSARLTDRAILIEQKNVIQSNPLCREASDIVSAKDCPALQEKLYNCSNMFDASNPRYASYADCVDAVIPDPMQLYVSCLRAQCGPLNNDNSDVTCQTLQKASDQCDDVKGIDSPYFPRYGVFPKVMEISDLLALANCTQL